MAIKDQTEIWDRFCRNIQQWMLKTLSIDCEFELFHIILKNMQKSQSLHVKKLAEN